VTKKIVLVTSATGRQGGATARRLLADGFQVRAFVRDSESVGARGLVKVGAELAVGDMDDRGSLEVAMRGAYGAFSLQPSLIPPHFSENELQQGLNIADAARSAQVHHLVYVSVAGADSDTAIPHWQIKGQIEKYIRRLGVPFTMLRPTMFMENYADPTYGVTSDNSVLGMIPPGTIVQHIAIADIGAFAALAFSRPGRFMGQAMELAGDELTRDDIIVTINRIFRRPVAGPELPRISMAPAGRHRSDDQLARFGGWHADIRTLRALYPPLLTFEMWLKQGGAASIEKLLNRPG
jgi:uncharacterized protein YbjT (DUF2867 family)